MFKKTIPGSGSSLNTVDHEETYGRHILDQFARQLHVEKCVDLGCGRGDDLSIVKNIHPEAECFGIDFGDWNLERLNNLGVKVIKTDIEKDQLPFGNESLDLVVANQILEHTKEIFWINHEIFRCLKVGGYFYLGVPNILSLHNRILGLAGIHPTQWKLLSAHVRPFSKHDTYKFYSNIGSKFCEIEKFKGSQFYPFPKNIARFFSGIFPGLSFSIFFLIRKTARYNGEFLNWPAYASLETNFYTGRENEK
ncbi:MAG: class I SAM-dependent methyltransferase [Bacillota bacterium]